MKRTQLNISTQGRSQTIIETTQNVTAFKGKLKLWKSKMSNMQLACFPALNELY